MDAIRVKVDRPKLEITTTNAKVHIRNAKPRMRIRIKNASMAIQQEPPQFKLSESEYRRQVRSMLSVGVPEELKARAGDRVADEINRVLMIGEYALNGEEISSSQVQIVPPFDELFLQELELNTNDIEAPKLEWEEGHFIIEWSDYAIEIEWDDVRGPEIEVEPHSIEVRLSHRPVVKISVNKDNIREAVGIKVDKKV